jgi:hypothetical protein
VAMGGPRQRSGRSQEAQSRRRSRDDAGRCDDRWLKEGGRHSAVRDRGRGPHAVEMRVGIGGWRRGGDTLERTDAAWLLSLRTVGGVPGRRARSGLPRPPLPSGVGDGLSPLLPNAVRDGGGGAVDEVAGAAVNMPMWEFHRCEGTLGRCGDLFD